MSDGGKLYVVPTPLGNLKDITIRALDVLKDADFILAEDTRTSGFLLKHFEISKPIFSYHKFNEHKSTQRFIDRLVLGETGALISDAGTPGISDPGFLMVRACVDAGIEVECLPGATALIPALVNSGLPMDRFVFEGFLPVKKGRKSRLEYLSHEMRTLIVYEAPFRLVKTLTEIAQYFGSDRQASISRELTKLHEEIIRGSLSDMIDHYTARPPKGEIVIVIQGAGKGTKSQEEDSDSGVSESS